MIKDKVYTEFTRFSAKIGWQAHFLTEPPRTDDPLLRIKNDNIADPPTLPVDAPIMNYLAQCKHNIDSFFSTYNPVINNKTHQPLKSLPYTKDEINNTLTTLRNNKDIVIKIADKSNAIVVLDTTEYHKQALKHLQDTDTYKELTTLPDPNITWKQLTHILYKYGHLTEGQFTRRNNPNKRTKLAKKLLEHAPKTDTDTPLTRPARFYVVMKMHKTPLASRPIASSINTITHNCSKYLDSILQPVMREIKSYTSSSAKVVNELTTLKLPKDCVILCLDVEALYPNIPIQEGVAAIHKYLTYKGLPLMQIDFICALMLWVLTNNFIEYGDLLFLQIKGTAMGTPFAVVFANLFLAHLEEILVIRQIHPDNRPLFSKRFIDDIFALCKTNEDAELYKELINREYPTINTTGTISPQSGIFLDIEIFKGPLFEKEQILDTKLYQKSTNKYLYLSPATYHPTHVLTGYITSEIKRYRTLCNSDTDYTTAKNNFYQRLIVRHYPVKFLTPLFTTHHDRKTLLTKQNEPNPPARPTFATMLGPDLEQIPLSKLLDPTQILADTPELTLIFTDKPPLLAKSHPDNLGQQIIRARIDYTPIPPNLTYPNIPYHKVYNKVIEPPL